MPEGIWEGTLLFLVVFLILYFLFWWHKKVVEYEAVHHPLHFRPGLPQVPPTPPPQVPPTPPPQVPPTPPPQVPPTPPPQVPPTPPPPTPPPPPALPQQLLEVIMNKKKNAAAAYIRSECCRSSTPETLKMVLDSLLDPHKKIDNDSFELIEWIKWLMAGGCSPEEFTANVRKYDSATTCGLVWTANFVAYRCRTCGISPCMSLCAECFQRGNHTGHDFNMFRSQAGGACDCGDMNVMKESGFCYLHGPHSQNPNMCPDGPNAAPPDLLCVASQMMPRLILRLIQHMRDNSNSLSGFLGSVQDADGFITMLHDMSGMGAAMRQVMTYALTNPQIYKNLTDIEEIGSSMNPAYHEYMCGSKASYEQALRSLPNPKPPDEYNDIPALQQDLVHRTFLEEFVFWTAKFEFPQKIVCLLLNLLPDDDYKEAFTRAFVLHYGRISQLLVQSSDPDMLSNRVVHVSVQLFSNEKLALRMAEQMGLLHVMVISLTYMMNKITVPCSLSSGGARNNHLVVDCGNQCMKDHCYWPLVSDLNNILSHRPVALRFLEDDGLIKMWFSFLSLFQGMNTNQRELHQHVEYEPTTYYAAFSTELEASASPMWALVSHLRDSSTAHLTKNLIEHCKEELKNWFAQIGFNGHDLDEDQVSFHLPLHRYLSVFLYQAVRNQGLSLRELLPSPKDLRAIIQHPLRVQTGFYEIISGLWVRNGLQIKGQAMTYVQCHFCNSMVDADLFLLQVAMMNLPYGEFLSTVLDRFNIMDSLSILDATTNSSLDSDHEILMIENCLIFLSSLASVRTSIGVSDSDLVTLEMVTLLCMGDKTHSQLMELMPERCGNSSQSKDFEAVLSKVAVYRAPNFEHGNMLQGMYVPRPFVWETLYDPIYILLRAVHRKDFQTSLDRFSEFAKHTGKFKGPGTPWPPFRIPELADAPYTDPRFVLHSRVFHGLLFVILYKAVNTGQSSDQLVSLAVYLLELALSVTDAIGPDVMSSREDPNDGVGERYDMNFASWFGSDCILANIKTEIDTILVKPNTDEAIPGSDSSDGEDNSADDVMDVESYDVAVEMFDEFDVEVANQPTGFTASTAAIGNLAIMPPSERMGSRDISVRGTLVGPPQPHGNSREVDMARRGMQMMISSPKPLISVQKKEVGRSSSTGGLINEVEVPVNESIISLLLKLHSKLSSSSPDSYTPYWDTTTAQTIISDAISGKQNGLDPGTFHGDGYTISYSPLFYTQLYEVMTEQGCNNSRIGDGPFFIGNVLDRICSKDNSCREYLLEMKGKLWPREAENEEEKLRREAEEEAERKKLASERRRQATEDMQRRQQAFMENWKKEMESGSNPSGETEEEDSEQDSYIKPLEYHCVICNLTGPSTPSNPMGLVILLQATSVLGHRRGKDSSSNSLPTTDEERLCLMAKETMSSVNEKRLQDMTNNFDDDSWLMAMSAGWEGGVHVQACGHHIHHECLRDYHTSLKTQQRQHNISIERGEYFCPLCRQLANSFLPLSSEFGIRKSALVKDRKGSVEPMTPETTAPEIPPSPEANVALEILKLLKEYPLPTDHSKMVDAMAKTMEEMTNATSLKYRKIGSTNNTKSILLFVNSIARSNLEMELVLCGGNLVSIPTDPQPSTSSASPPKRSCIVPLLHVLGVHYKILSTDQCLPKTWERILGVRFFPDTAVMTPDREVPLMLRDSTSTLLHFLMNLPMHVDSAYFSSMVQALYNHVYIQALCTISCRLRDKERAEWKAKKSLFPSSTDPMSKYTDINQLDFLLGTVIAYLEKSPIFLPDSDYGDMDYTSSSSVSPNISRSNSQTQVRTRTDGSFELNEDEIENQLENLLLPFVRIAALLRHHLYDEELPFISTIDEEFSLLGQFLGLGLSEATKTKYSTIRDGIKAHHFLFWISPTPLTAVWTWCEDLCNFVGKSQVVARSLLSTQNLSWGQPRLLELPHAYDSIFQYYHRRQCPKCNSIPKDPSVCLVCGTMVCLRDSCCKQQNIFEATQHAINCGAGTAMYLSVNSSTIVVIRGKRACLWGSVYLDSFGEEDRELKRGKPLFLSKERYALLQQQWVTHRFDHSPRKWIFHRDAL